MTDINAALWIAFTIGIVFGMGVSGFTAGIMSEHTKRRTDKVIAAIEVFMPSRNRCAATDGDARCTEHAGHYGAIHREIRDGKLWAEWRSILPTDEPAAAQTCRCTDCHIAGAIDAAGYVRPPF